MNVEEIMASMNRMEKEKERETKLLLRAEWVIGILSLIILFGAIFVATFFDLETLVKIAVIAAGFVICFTVLMFCMKIEQLAGYYECKHCQHKHTPSFWKVFLAMHMGRTRYMKCPECGKRSWQRKRIRK